MLTQYNYSMIIIRSPEAWGVCVCVRERERERERGRERKRRKWRHHCRAKIGDEFTLCTDILAGFTFNNRVLRFPAIGKSVFNKTIAGRRRTLLLSLHFPLPKIRINCRWVYTFPCQKFAQLARSLHVPLPKIRTFRFSLHTSRLSLLKKMVTIAALKLAMSSHFPLPKHFALFVPTLSNGTSRTRRVIENSRQMIKSCPVLHCSSHRKNE